MDPKRAKTTKDLVSYDKVTYPVGTEVLVYETEGLQPWLCEVPVEDESLVGGFRYDYLDASEDELDFI